MGTIGALPDLFIVNALLFSGGAYFIACRQTMMRLRLIAIISFGIYFILSGAYAGALACLISLTGTLVQAVVPDRLLKKTLYWRTGISVVLAGAGILIFGGSESPFALIATIVSRFSELQGCTQRIKLGFMLSHIMWLTYAVQEGLVIALIVEATLLFINACAFLFQSHRARRMAALPAAAV